MSAQADTKMSSQKNGTDVRQLREAWVEAFNRSDWEKVGRFYEADAVELPLNGTPAVNGATAIRELLQSMFSAGWSDLKVWQTQVGYTGPLAVEVATYTIKAGRGNGAGRIEKGRLVATWRRAETGEFKITISVWTKELNELEV